MFYTTFSCWVLSLHLYFLSPGVIGVISETIKQDAWWDGIVVDMSSQLMSPLVVFLFDLHSVENMEYRL